MITMKNRLSKNRKQQIVITIPVVILLLVVLGGYRYWERHWWQPLPAGIQVQHEAASQHLEAGKKLNIGDKYGGGIVFDLDRTGQHGLIAATSDMPGHSESFSEGEFTLENAKARCAALGDHWRLPTKDELNKLYHAKRIVGGFAVGPTYWSSSEYSASDEFYQNFRSGRVGHSSKTNSAFVRVVRAF